MSITASQVKDLREKTGVGMMDCKKALTETDGDMEKAIDYLRKKGIAKAAKRADRASKAGLISLVTSEDGKSISMLELNCETDFVAKNDDFNMMSENLVKQVAATKYDSMESLLSSTYIADESKTVSDMMADAVAKIGESLKIGRFRTETAGDTEYLTHYIHTGASIGVVVKFAAENSATFEKAEFGELAHDIAMHVAAAGPEYLDEAAVPSEIVEKEKEIYKAEALESGKPEQILDKIATGKLGKFFKDNCLVKQDFVKDPDISIEGLVEKASKELGDKLEIKTFIRMKVGEGE